jgi:GNAT superfamily N-acetyltransferase
MEIRDGKPQDRDAILALDHVVKVEPGRARFIERVLRSATCLVAEHEGRVVAYGALEYTFFENGFVSMLYVTEGERRRGIGTALLKALTARCATRKLFTSTNQSNRPMQELLISLGYRRSGVIENLDPDDPEVVYFLELGGPSA